MKMSSILFFFVLTCTLSTTCSEARTVPSSSHRVRKDEEKEECPKMFAPYMTSIRDREGQHYCGGVVISENAVLTSAACVDRRIYSSIAPQPVLYIGGTNIDDPVQKRLANGIFIHARWDGNPIHGYNIAIVKLDRPTCMWPVKYLGKRDPKRETFTAFGYGRTGAGGKYSTYLQGANVTYIDHDICNKKFNVTITKREACFRVTTGGAGICLGGPILHAPLSPVYQDSLIAINSFTIGKCDELDSVAIGTNVEAFLDWIDEILESNFFKDDSEEEKKVSKEEEKKK